MSTFIPMMTLLAALHWVESECGRTDNSGVIAELQRRLKVAEDALSGVVQSYDIIGADPDTGDEYGTIKESAYVNAKNALAAIREEGEVK